MFQGYGAPDNVLNWKTFAMDIATQFGQESYDNSVGQITKLRQTSFVHIYQEQVEALIVRIRGLMEEFFLQCFVSGLMDAIKNQVMMFKPTTLSQDIGLTLLQENTIKAMIKEATLSSKTPTNLDPTMQEEEQETSRKILSLKKLSHVGMQEIRNKKLCYCCDKQ